MTDKKRKRVFADVPLSVGNAFLGKAKRDGTSGKALLERFIRTYVEKGKDAGLDEMAGKPLSLSYEHSRSVLGLAAILSDAECPDLYRAFADYAVAVIEKYLKERAI